VVPLFVLLGVVAVFAGGTVLEGGTRVGIGFSFGSGSGSAGGLSSLFSGPISDARQLEDIVRRIGKDRESLLEAAEKNGDLDKTPPVNTFPGWARCQEIALQSRPEMLLVRMNMQALRAAIDILKGKSDDYDDSIGRDFPPGFDARDWGEEILARCGARGRNRDHLKRALSHEASAMRCLFTDVRDGINRDVVFDHHTWERSNLDKTQNQARNRASWKLWYTLGCPR